jgi:hypothetical protein
VSSDVAIDLASEKSTKEEILDSMNPIEEEKSMKLSIKKVGIGTQGGRIGRCWDSEAS